MILRSIRWRLTLAFAGIALVAALALGAVLLTIVQNYYAQQEQTYLQSNAKSISATLAKVTVSDLPEKAIRSQVENLAFLAQTRVRVFDAAGGLLYDSGSPQAVNISVGVARQQVIFEGPASEKSPSDFLRIISVGDVITKTIRPPEGSAEVGTLIKDQRFILYTALPAAGTPFGFNLGSTPPSEGGRSSQVVRVALLNGAGQLDGSVELSEGPALGREITDSVARGWVLAGAIAVLFAAGVGWFISRRISAPLLVLTDVTGRMAAGNLSCRADVDSHDEFGQLARSFNEMADQVETTVLALRRFVSDAAHQLHTPLTALRTNLDLAHDGSGAENPYIEHAQENAQRLEELTRNLLDLSRLEATQAAPDTCTDLTACIEERAESYASQAEQAGLVFEKEVPDQPVVVQADPIRVGQALDNLVDNACKFTPAGGIVRVRCRIEDAAGEFATVSVSDTGIGIPVEDIPLLAQRFHRGRNATAFPGSGLGLAIVKAIMDQEGGQLIAENANPGARFILKWRLGPDRRS